MHAVTLRLPDDTWEALRQKAKARGMTPSALLRETATLLVHEDLATRIDNHQTQLDDHETRIRRFERRI